MTVKGVIFDMDGLLIDTEKWYQKFWVQAAREQGFPMKPEHVLEIRSLPAVLAAEKLRKLVATDFDYQVIIEKSKAYMRRHIEENGIEKKKGADELLHYLKAKGIKRAIATATAPKVAKGYLRDTGIYDCFDQFVSAHMVQNGKPQPDIYLEAAKRLQLPPAFCIALEDSPNGVLSAYRAGCMTVMVPDLSQPDEETKKLLYATAEDLEQVIHIIETAV